MTDRDPMYTYLNQLVGWTVDHAIIVRGDPEDETMYGLVFTHPDNKKHQLCALILRDEEGNGPGFLVIEKEKYGT
jgi:hypothetical protein